MHSLAILQVVLALAMAAGRPASAAEPSFPRVELLTLGPGEPMFTRYGHVALRVIHADGRDLSYNFGLTDFHRENFELDFLSGRVEFWGRPYPYRRTEAEARRFDRTLTRWPLLLDDDKKAQLITRLNFITRPENRNYIYDTFRDNCATRVRDVLDLVTGGALRRAAGEGSTGRSYHDDVRLGFANLFGLLLALEIVPGVELDRERNHWEMLYHPLRLAEVVARAQVGTGDRMHPLAGPAEVVYRRRGPDALEGWPNAARALLLGLAGLWLLAALTARRRRRRWSGVLLAWWALWSGLIGLVLIVVHFWTSWPDMRFNWLMAGMVPLDLWLLGPAWTLLRGRRPGPGSLRLAQGWLWLRTGVFVLVVLATGVLGLSPANPSAQALALAGLALALAVLRSEAVTSTTPAEAGRRTEGSRGDAADEGAQA